MADRSGPLNAPSPLAAPQFTLYFISAARARIPRVKCGGGSPHFFVLGRHPRRDVKDALEAVVVSELDAVGFDLVELRRGGTRTRPLIEVRIYRRDGAAVTV